MRDLGVQGCPLQVSPMICVGGLGFFQRCDLDFGEGIRAACVRMFVYVHIHSHTYIYIYVCMHTYIYTYMYAQVSTCI